MYIKRYIEDTILELHRTFKIIYLAGPRQVGKTTVLQHLGAQTGAQTVSLDDLRLRDLALKDPELFLDSYETPLIIDEVQYAPQLFPALKRRVDARAAKGQYWLTGSQQFSSLRHIQESLAGRVAILTLLGFSSAERERVPKKSTPTFLSRRERPAPRIREQNIYKGIFRGSFPHVWLPHAPSPEHFYNSYIQTYIDRDLREIFGVEKIPEFHMFLRLCAARTGQMLNYSELARDAGVSVHAAREWIGILESIGHVFLLQPYFANRSKRLIKSPKLYFLDTGLAAFLTRWQSPRIMESGAMAGAFFETHVVSEVVKSYLFRGKTPPLFYARDKQGHEVDLVIEDGRNIVLIEVKARATIRDDDAGGLRYFLNSYPNGTRGCIISLSKERYPLDRNIEVLPVEDIE